MIASKYNTADKPGTLKDSTYSTAEKPGI